MKPEEVLFHSLSLSLSHSLAPSLSPGPSLSSITSTVSYIRAHSQCESATSHHSLTGSCPGLAVRNLSRKCHSLRISLLPWGEESTASNHSHNGSTFTPSYLLLLVLRRVRWDVDLWWSRRCFISVWSVWFDRETGQEAEGFPTNSCERESISERRWPDALLLSLHFELYFPLSPVPQQYHPTLHTQKRHLGIKWTEN